jgi:sterol desaturase/sphingolipid hydroxylase (fatty acid hydroxylase superfamily)
MPKNFVSNKDESARLFKSNFLEMFSHVHPAIPLVVYLPVIGYFLYRAGSEPIMSPAGIIGLFLAGVFVWTLTEYLLHRFVFHYQPHSEWGKKLHFLMHGVHHDYPNDSLRLVMPPVISVPLAMLFYFLFVALLGEVNIGLWLKHHHMRHHYQTDEYNYGVSSPLWDFVFGTFQEKGSTGA